MQIFLDGLIQGLLIAVMAIGFAAVYNSTGILHIAQGAVYAISPFIFLWVMQLEAGVPLAIAGTITTAIALSIVIERINHWPLHRKEASGQIHLISSFGIYICVVQIIAILWGNESKVLRYGIEHTFTLSDIILAQSQVLGGIISLILLLIFFIWIKKTGSGLKFMALSDNPIQLSLMGYDIRALRLLAFGLSGIFTAIASMLTAMDIGFDPQAGLSVVLLAIVATIIGGKGSFAGPVIGGILIGIIRSQVVWYTSARWQDTITFLILVLFLFFRPQGILGKKGRIEAL